MSLRIVARRLTSHRGLHTTCISFANDNGLPPTRRTAVDLGFAKPDPDRVRDFGKLDIPTSSRLDIGTQRRQDARPSPRQSSNNQSRRQGAISEV